MKSKKQHVVARNNAEVEFGVMTQGICEGIWLKRMLEEIIITTNYTINTENMEIVRHFVQEKIHQDIIRVNHVLSLQYLRLGPYRKNIFSDF